MRLAHLLVLTVLGAACGGPAEPVAPAPAAPDGSPSAGPTPSAPTDPPWEGPPAAGELCVVVPWPASASDPVLAEVTRRHPGLHAVPCPAAGATPALVMAWADTPEAQRPAEPLPSGLRSRVPAPFAAPDRVAVAAVARIIVARRTLGTRPQRLTDLADPRWAGKMQIQDPNEAGFRRDLGALLTARGPGATRRFLVDLSAVVNIRPPVPTEEEIARALMDGSAQVAMLDHPSARAAVPPGLGPDEAPVELSAPSTEAGGVAFRPLVASIPSGFSGRDSALAALDALLTLQAQRALVSLTGFYPVHPLAEPPAGLPPIAPDQWAATPLADERSRNDSLDRLLVQVGLRPGVDDAGQEGGGIAAPVPGGPPTASESSPQPVR